MYFWTKRQNTSTKFQINSKFEISMTETKCIVPQVRLRSYFIKTFCWASKYAGLSAFNSLPNQRIEELGTWYFRYHYFVLNLYFRSLDIVCYLSFEICYLFFSGLYGFGIFCYGLTPEQILVRLKNGKKQDPSSAGVGNLAPAGRCRSFFSNSPGHAAN